jgi:predicted peroxiredoxin
MTFNAMKRIVLLLALSGVTLSFCAAQSAGPADSAHAKPDSPARAKTIADSLKMEKLFAVEQFPLIKGSKWSGVIPVENPTEVPDPDREYKLLFEFTARNPDSTSGEINSNFDEIARLLNLHVASGIPAKNIVPVIVIHGPGLQAVMTNEAYRKKHSIDNPNLKIIQDLENAGAKIIACGQAMAFFGVAKEELLPDIKISLTAQTALSNYQLQGFVRYSIEPDK